MRRLARWTLNALTALSLFLCAVALALGLRGRTHGTEVCTAGYWQQQERPDGNYNARQLEVVNGPDRVVVAWRRRCVSGLSVRRAGARAWGTSIEFAPRDAQSISAMTESDLRAVSPFAGARWVGTPFVRVVAAPPWLAAAVFAVLPGVWVARLRRRGGGAGDGLCSACGYDMRATPAKCPECGRVAAAEAPAADAV